MEAENDQALGLEQSFTFISKCQNTDIFQHLKVVLDSSSEEFLVEGKAI